jgi:hypothetical protein
MRLRPEQAISIPGWDAEVWRKSQRRVQKMSTRELLSWTDVAGSGMARGLRDYQSDDTGVDGAVSLLEIRETLVTMYALVHELLIREDAD